MAGLRGVLALLLTCASLACQPTERASDSREAVATPRPGNVAGGTLDPSRLAPGDSVLGLRVVAVDLQPSVVDSGEWIGEVQFEGRVRLSGEYGGHPDYPEPPAICFYADSASAARLPRFPNDARYGWLCFTNPESARAWLGDPAQRRPAHVTVEAFRYSYSHTDVFNTARLVRAPR